MGKAIKNTRVGGEGFEPSKSSDSRFTVCPSWPLWYPPNRNFNNDLLCQIAGFTDLKPCFLFRCAKIQQLFLSRANFAKKN